MNSATQACLDVPSWRIPTRQELREHFDGVLARAKDAGPRTRPSVLAVRRSLSPVDVYCYLKARFGDPNGFQTFLRKEDSDNLVHWDFNLKAGQEDVYISGTSREVHFVISAEMADANWHDLLQALKRDFGRVGQKKSEILKSLEKWVIFPNRFAHIADLCAELHAEIAENSGSFRDYKIPPAGEEGQVERASMEKLLDRLARVNRSSLELSLLTPILAEAFINMAILILCKPEVRDNARQFDDFIRSNIDVKLFDLAYKCKGFVRPIDQHSESFKRFKRVMDKRNHIIHGNCDPEAEQLETVYFEGTRPLFCEAGDHIGKFLERQERQYQPDKAIEDYEVTHEFLNEIANCLEPSLAESFRAIMEDRYPGFDVGRRKMGRLFPDYVAATRMEGVPYHDELIPPGVPS